MEKIKQYTLYIFLGMLVVNWAAELCAKLHLFGLTGAENYSVPYWLIALILTLMGISTDTFFRLFNKNQKPCKHPERDKCLVDEIDTLVAAHGSQEVPKDENHST